MTDWRPTAGLAALRRRAALIRRIRVFFDRRGLLEVETPLMATAPAMDPNLDSLAVSRPDGCPAWLQTSPEYAMKRLLAAGSGDIWQLTRAFRGSERGRLHNPEFTLLEWYRVGWDHHALMQEVAELAAELAGERPVEHWTYRDAFQHFAGLDPFQAPLDVLRARGGDKGLTAALGEDRDAWLDLILSREVAPRLGRGRLSFLTDFPASQAALARLRPGDPPVAERFELFMEGMEIANGYHELADPAEQRRRFRAEQQARDARGERLPVDQRLLAALEAGLPPCAGVALGVDRLVMVALGAECIDAVWAFPDERA
ncbi:EF-P lysine aminoacylase EpmA [Alkalilimnicola ehrlichii MLHE-1]|uniref:tRNA synthetase, class II (D, K and N) n=1 Tax=Alkalilimnicola ehrlichii (strain ATCC BAA-1101 / DSM 17681 / MLHE-1) TaxID=187272 RepID=Q0AAU8_ALKEH|nr:EF-P lysine aminoacylase EpmA [Alkalilimnicola ehrlichii]ABI56039.1 tRNA synthetase, class II (D, K and N) [Alkalilimnicola ehrlichii MLHE-1]